MTQPAPVNGLCAICGGTVAPSRTIFSADLGTGVVVVRNVPALVCERCGSEWFDDATAAEIERRTEDVRRRGAQVEVLSLP